MCLIIYENDEWINQWVICLHIPLIAFRAIMPVDATDRVTNCYDHGNESCYDFRSIYRMSFCRWRIEIVSLQYTVPKP